MPYALTALTLLTLILLYRHPFWRWVPLLLVRTALGAGALWLLEGPVAYLGGTLGLNLLTALLAGILGLPGLLLLVGLAFWP